MVSFEAEFRAKGVVRGGELMLRPADAIAFVRRCREHHIEVLGVDGFHLTDISTQPDMGESVDLSIEYPKSGLASWDRAEQFLAQRLASDLFFKIVAD